MTKLMTFEPADLEAVQAALDDIRKAVTQKPWISKAEYIAEVDISDKTFAKYLPKMMADGKAKEECGKILVRNPQAD